MDKCASLSEFTRWTDTIVRDSEKLCLDKEDVAIILIQKGLDVLNKAQVKREN